MIMYISHGGQSITMGFRTRITSRPATRFGSLLVLNLVVQALFITFIAVTPSRDCGTLMPGETPPPPIPFFRTSGFLHILLAIEVLTTVLFLMTNWVSLALVAYASAWTIPSLTLPISAIIPVMFVLPLVMLLQVRRWEFEDGPRRRWNPVSSNLSREV